MTTHIAACQYSFTLLLLISPERRTKKERAAYDVMTSQKENE